MAVSWYGNQIALFPAAFFTALKTYQSVGAIQTIPLRIYPSFPSYDLSLAGNMLCLIIQSIYRTFSFLSVSSVFSLVMSPNSCTFFLFSNQLICVSFLHIHISRTLSQFLSQNQRFYFLGFSCLICLLPVMFATCTVVLFPTKKFVPFS